MQINVWYLKTDITARSTPFTCNHLLTKMKLNYIQFVALSAEISISLKKKVPVRSCCIRKYGCSM